MNAKAFVAVVVVNVVATVVAMWLINQVPELRAIVNGR